MAPQTIAECNGQNGQNGNANNPRPPAVNVTAPRTNTTAG